MTRYFLHLLFILGTFYTVSAQRLQFNALTVQDGLSQHDVSSIIQDSEGFLWVGTYDGLNRFDGYTVESFFHKNEDEFSLSSNRIRCLLEDDKSRIWAGTDGYGLNYYSLKSGNIKRLKVPESFEIINDLIQDAAGNILVATENGLLKISENQNILKVEILQSPLTGIQVKKIDLIGDNQIIYATNKGLWLFQNDTYTILKDSDYMPFRTIVNTTSNKVWTGGKKGLFEVIDGKLVQEKSLANFDILSVIEGTNSDLWIATFQNGLIHFNMKTKTLTKTEAADYNNQNSLLNNPINQVFLDENHTLWVSNRKGLLYSNLESKKFSSLPIAKRGHVRTLFATNDRVYYGFQTDKFYSYNFSTKSNNLINIDKEAKAFKVDTLNGRIHLATTKGLYVEKNVGKGEFEPVSIFQNTNKEKDLIVTSFCKDKFGNQYFGSFKGLIYKDSKSTNFIPEKFQNFESLRNIRVIALKFDYFQNAIWVATISKGLFKINLNESGEMISLESYNEEMTGSYHIPNNSIWCFYQDKKGTLFVGTDTGLLQKSLEQNKFLAISSEHIKNKKIMGVISDKDSNLWLTNSQGIIKYSPNSEVSYNYNYNDGLLTNTFTEAVSSNENGQLFFGNISGINYLKFDELVTNPFPSKISLTKLLVNNKTVKVNENILGSTLLHQRLNKTKDLVFSYKQNDFTIEFTSTNYANVKVNKYRYKLINYDKNWQVVANNKRTAKYSRIPSGNYKLIVQATNPDGKWSNESKSININIKPAPWNSWWAYLLYFLLISLILYTIFYFWSNKQKLRTQIELSNLKNEQEKEINEMKLVFFTDVAHEFKTPLSLIIGPLDDLIKNNTSTSHKKFCYNILSRNTNRMMNLVNQLLDFRKINSGINILQVSRNDLCAFVKNVSKSFEWQAESTDIKLSIISPESYFCHFDKDILEKVIYNLLSNAFKYTPYGGVIEIEIKPTWKHDLEYFVILIKDSGKGISQTNKRRIFERYVHGKDRDSSGIGLHLTAKLIEAHKGEINVLNSALGGTEFMITLPVSSKAFTEEEFLSKDDIPLVIPSHFTPGDTPNTNEEIEENEENGKEKILIVEDDHDLRKYLRNILLSDYKVVEATNGFEGVEMCIKELPDIVITDVMMPELDGVAMCEKIKKNILVSHIPILMLTAKTDEEFYNRGLKVGAWDYIAKPFNTSQLLQKVKNISETRNSFREHLVKGIPEKTKNHYVSFDQKFVLKAGEIIKKQMSNPNFSVEMLSTELGLSRMQLHRKLKTLIGSNTTAFINSIRIKEAIQMFDDGCDRVQEAMDGVGINSYAHFITLFKKEKGITPSKYIEQLKELSEIKK
ncbi:hybrid sensor histidine kinase/response regulator transcription factor [Polaribacter sp.]|uniref:hybrid sensor histidine kinase/response regulator transcription factor n=1 Tax=Polaribacter sp. TaxID=1920175 RepID=UPI003F6C54F8